MKELPLFLAQTISEMQKNWQSFEAQCVHGIDVGYLAQKEKRH
jgi:hypothetical protein